MDKINAYDLAQSVRYSEDINRGVEITNSKDLDYAKRFFSHEGLLASSKLTPGIYDTIEFVTQRLNLDKNKVETFVYASSEIQASCYSVNNDNCLISLSSGLVGIMEPEELSFVIGHELGHFLLNHGCEEREDNKGESLEFYLDQRAKEISADRIGLLSSPSLDKSIRSIIKTISGLSSEQLNFDVTSFVDQIRSSELSLGHKGSFLTHPSMLIRTKALFWFSLSSDYLKFFGKEKGKTLEEVDRLVSKDMNQYVDSSAKKEITVAKEDFNFWLFVSAAVADGKFTKDEQSIFITKWGLDKTNKLLSMIRDLGKEEAKRVVEKKLKDSALKYRNVAPEQSKTIIPKLIKETKEKFDDFTDIQLSN